MHLDDFRSATQLLDFSILGLEAQFRTITPIYSSVYNLPYDYYSVMHYDAFAFSNGLGGVTMQPKDGRFLRLIGKVQGASTTDFEKVRRIYGCSNQPGGNLLGADAGGFGKSLSVLSKLRN